MHPWLEQARDRIARAAGEEPGGLTLTSEDEDAILELAKVAAHESGERTNAPLVCYLAGVAAGRRGLAVEDVADAAARRL